MLAPPLTCFVTRALSHHFCCHLLSGSYYVPSTVLLDYIHCYFIFTVASLGDTC